MDTKSKNMKRRKHGVYYLSLAILGRVSLRVS